MPKLASKSNARVAHSGGLPAHPALANPDSLLQYRLGNEDPIRLPDSFSQPTAATVLRSEYTISSDAAGHAAFAENFSLVNSKVVWPVTAGVLAASGTSTNHPQLTAFSSEARSARQVAYKVQVMYIGAEQTSAGYLSFSEKFDALDIQGMGIDGLHTGSLMQVKAADGALAFGDFTQEPRWESPATSTFMQSTFPILLFVSSGLPLSTPVFRVRVSRYLEYLPVEGAIAENATRHEPSNPGALSVHGELASNSTSFTSLDKLSEFYKGVKKVANAAYHMAQPLLPYVVPKAREFLASNYARGAATMLLTL